MPLVGWLLIMLTPPAEPLPPQLACYLEVTYGYGLDNANATQLCIGASSDAPARCFLEASRLGPLTDAYSIQLCTGATSDAPVRCFAGIGNRTGLVTANTVTYCQALHWPLVIPPTTGSPACVDAASRIGLATQQVIDVCQGSASAAPAECVDRGRSLTGLTDSYLVNLCTTRVPLEYGNVPAY